MNKPIIIIPIGDPAGIGPEIVAKALIDRDVSEKIRSVVVGNEAVMTRVCGVCGIDLKINVISSPKDGDYRPGVLNLISLDNIDAERLPYGQVDGNCGRAAFEYIKKSIEIAMAGEADAVCTTPINKESLKAGGVNFIGHTEIFGSLTGTPDPLTMFEVRNLRVFFLSRHLSLRNACDMVTEDRLIDYIHRCWEMLKGLGVQDGVMAVAGLNPHCGEHGLFGNEEEAVVAAVEKLKKEGLAVEGPVGADSVFHMALKGRFNSVLSLYHDQGHIATKTLDFERTISVTGGMPILRTSVDHGTALDIAWKNIASPVSMIEAITVAAKYAPLYKKR